MQLQYPREAQEFGEQLRAFVRAELPAAIRDKVLADIRITPDEQRFWQRKLIEHNLATPGWPTEYGGPGWSELQRHVYDTVMSQEGAPAAVIFGENMVASALFVVGTQEQKAHYLPRIRSLEYYFCQAFSEPGSGSDLASLKTQATLDGDEWTINGHKIWTSFAHFANMMVCLVRTDPDAKPQQGISMLLLPTAAKGVTIRPIVTIDGAHHTNEVFFDDVRVPRTCLVGEVNKGWDYAKLLLGHERTSVARIGKSKRELARLKALAAKPAIGAPLNTDPAFRNKVAMLECELLVFEITALRMIVRGQDAAPGVEASLFKIKGSEIQQRITELKMEALGPYGIPFDPERGLAETNLPPAELDDAAACGGDYLYTRVVTIYGGSNEIQRNIIAKSLGL
jgi:alkylation response protein AidB-like acyl-CoA dehydrogenase